MTPPKNVSPSPTSSLPSDSMVVGIDLGTTNSAVGWVRHGKPEVIQVGHHRLLPSVAGWTPGGELVVGHPALNQYALYPERTVRSVKRAMGTDRTYDIDGKSWTPVELSAIILRTLRQAAEVSLGAPVTRAVITVPAFFDDAQRVATRQAGELAGFVVERVLNEPTAAALCYGGSGTSGTNYVVYDLGGGTFDVSVVRVHGDVTEVLASDGDVHLGGDDMDALLVQLLVDDFTAANGQAPAADDHRAAARLQRAAEAAKISLSTEVQADVAEENLSTVNGVPSHLATQMARPRYEEVILPLLERTLASVNRALRAASLSPEQIDDLILVGGASRTPLVGELLRQHFGWTGREDVNPDEAVVLGASIAAARVGGQKVNRILVDICPHTLGVGVLAALSEYGEEFPVSEPIIARHTPIPVRRSRVFYTVSPGQQAVDFDVYQGESTIPEENTLLGSFALEGLDQNAPSGSPIATEMQLSIDGTLEVTAREVRTGQLVRVSLQAPVERLSEVQVSASRQEIEALTDWDSAPTEPNADDDAMEDHDPSLAQAVRSLVKRTDVLLFSISGPDAEELAERLSTIRECIGARDWDARQAAVAELEDVIFYLEG